MNIATPFWAYRSIARVSRIDVSIALTRLVEGRFGGTFAMFHHLAVIGRKRLPGCSCMLEVFVRGSTIFVLT
jgi:hypothetical protein